jgi:hypothetical protein
VDAGAIHGVVEGTIFTVIPHQVHSSGAALVVVVKVHTTWSVVVPTTSILPAAIVCYWANKAAPFKIGFQHSSEIPLQMQGTLDRLTETTRFRRLSGSRRGFATYPDSIDEEEILFERKDELVMKTKSTPISKRTRQKSCGDWSVINSIARFNLHLYRENSTHPYRDQVCLSLFSIEDGDLEGEDDMLNGYARLMDNYGPEETCCGAVVQNRSHVDLWCSLYYFGPSDCSITNIYSPPSPNMFPPLRKHSSSLAAEEQELYPGEAHDTGFVKLFISEKYADLTLME